MSAEAAVLDAPQTSETAATATEVGADEGRVSAAQDIINKHVQESQDAGDQTDSSDSVEAKESSDSPPEVDRMADAFIKLWGSGKETESDETETEPEAAAPSEKQAEKPEERSVQTMIEELQEKLELPEFDEDTDERFRALPKAVTQADKRSAERVENLRAQVNTAFNEIANVLNELYNDRDDVAFDDYISDAVEEDSELSAVLGSGPTRKLAKESVAAKARKKLREGLTQIARTPKSVGLDPEIARLGLFAAVKKAFKPKAEASERAGSQPRSNGQFVKKAPTTKVGRATTGKAPVDPQTARYEAAQAIIDRDLGKN